MKSLLSLVFLAVVILTGCSGASNTMQGTYIDRIKIEPLKDTDYEIIGDVKGEGSVTYVMGIKFGGSHSGNAPLPHSSSFPSFDGTSGVLLIAAGAVGVYVDPIAGAILAVPALINLIFSGDATAEDEAMYNAISTVPGADALISPRVDRSYFRVLPFYSKEEAKVTAKAIRIKIRK